MDPTLPSTSPSSSTSTDVNRPAGCSVRWARWLRASDPGRGGPGLGPDQARACDRRPDPRWPSNTATSISRDLRQSILELNLISPELLNQLAFERLTALAGGHSADRLPATKAGRPRRDAPALARSDPAPARHPQGAPGARRRPPPCPTWSRRSSNAPSTRRATDIHFDPQETRPAGPLPDRRPAPGHPRARAGHRHRR